MRIAKVLPAHVPLLSIRFLVTLGVLVTLSGCSTSSRVDVVEIIDGSSPVLAGVESPEELALQELDSVPTEFLVPVEDALPAKERMDLFFARFLSDGKQSSDFYQVTPSMGSGMLRKASSKNYLYEVLRTPTPRGYSFVVRCFPVSSQAAKGDAWKNARNLARFIRDGKLEENLLVR